MQSELGGPSESVFLAHARHGSEVITVLEADNAVRYESPAIYRLLGYRPVDDMRHNPQAGEWMGFIHPDDHTKMAAAVAGCLATPGESPPVEYRIRHADGSWRWFESRGVNAVDDPEIGGVVVSTRDITDRKSLEEEMAHRATHDPLTGLPNRRLFEDRLEHALSRQQRSDQPLAVLFIDLDDFKPVNDGNGHDAGDELLVAVAGRLSNTLRPKDTICRIGGDEFVILLEDTGQETASEVAERIAANLHEPFTLHGPEGEPQMQLFLTASIGVAVSGSAAGEGYQPSKLLREADAAMYRTKRSGKARYEVTVVYG